MLQSVDLNVQDLDEAASPEDLMLGFVSSEKGKVSLNARLQGLNTSSYLQYETMAAHVGRASSRTR